MWLGLLLIVLRLFTTNQWDTLKASFMAVTSEGLTAVSNSSSSLLQAGEGFSLPGSAAIPAFAADLVSPALGPNGKPVASKSNPAGPASSPKAGAPGGSQP